MNTCPRTGKLSHQTAQQARGQLISLKRRRRGYNGRVYHCRHCGGYHVGRLSADARPRRDH